MLNENQLRTIEATAQSLLQEEDYHQFLDKKSENILRITKNDAKNFTDKLIIGIAEERVDKAPLFYVDIEYSNPLLIRLIATYAWLKIRLDRLNPEWLPESQSIFTFDGSTIFGKFEEQELVAMSLAMVLPCDNFLEDIELNGGIDYDTLSKDYAVDIKAIRMRIINLQVMGEIY